MKSGEEWLRYLHIGLPPARGAQVVIAIESAQREAWDEAVDAAVAAVGQAMVGERIDRRQRAQRAIRSLHREEE